MKVNLLTFAIFFFACSRNIPTEKVYFNGRIWTGDKKNPHATAIYVKDSTIVFVGSDENEVHIHVHEKIQIHENDSMHWAHVKTR